MNNLSTFLPCGKAGYFPTPATYEWSVLSAGDEWQNAQRLILVAKHSWVTSTF